MIFSITPTHAYCTGFLKTQLGMEDLLLQNTSWLGLSAALTITGGVFVKSGAAGMRHSSETPKVVAPYDLERPDTWI